MIRPPSKAASRARAARVSKCIPFVAQFVIKGASFGCVESSNNPTIAEKAPSLQLPS